jgi:RNA recognition motif-containing protein
VTESLVQQSIESALSNGRGTVSEVRLVRYAETQKPKGYGYVDFKDEQTARRAVEELNGRIVMGRELKLDLEGPKHRPKNY